MKEAVISVFLLLLISLVLKMKKVVISVFPLLLISLVFSRASGFERSSTTVKLHETATLQCKRSCSGLVKWIHKDTILASCDQTSCQSQEGFQMLHDEYLKGNLSLIITDADFTKRKWYTCQCGGEDICHVSLRLEPFSYSVPVQAGKPFSLDLPISEDVEVTFKRSDDASNTSTLCTVKGHKAQCSSSYEVSSKFLLRKVKNDDGGVYTIRDIHNDEVIGTYTVTINETNAKIRDDPVAGVQSGQSGSGVIWMVVIFGVKLLLAVVVIVVLGVKYRKLQRENVVMRMQVIQPRVEEDQEQVEDIPVRMQDIRPRVEEEQDQVENMLIPVMDSDDGQIEEKTHDSEEDDDDRGRGSSETDPLASPSSVSDEPPLSSPVPESSQFVRSLPAE